MGKIVSITSYRGHLVAVDENGDIWAGSNERDLTDPDFMWHLVMRR